MRVRLKFRIRCSPDAAWEALHSAQSAGQVYGPLLTMRPQIPLPGGRFEPGRDIVMRVLAFDRFPVGRQRLYIRHSIVDRTPPARRFHDTGGALSGPLALLKPWDHQMTIVPVPGDPNQSVWLDQVKFGGVFAPVLWPVVALAWYVRKFRVQHLAPEWDARYSDGT